MNVPLDEIHSALEQEGYYHGHTPAAGEPIDLVLQVSRAIGDLFVPQGCDPTTPVIRTAPTGEPDAPPFDRPQAIGWHGDFATFGADRPELSVVYVTRPDPRGDAFGAWRLASVHRVLARMHETRAGRESFDFLSNHPIPFSYSDKEAPSHHLVIERNLHGRTGLRFYMPSIRRGFIAEYGTIPEPQCEALALLERAADEVGELVITREGSLLVASNWFALHDRLQQSVGHSGPGRESLLCFVARQHSV